MKHRFFNDYSEGAHPSILQSLNEINETQDAGYGLDSVSTEASRLIRHRLENPEAEVHFVSGGTQANLVVLAALLRPYEAVIAADSGHINVHEAGAIEATGHRVIAVPSPDGKLTPEQIAEVVAVHSDEHMVLPRVVFVSNATELGGIYGKGELEKLAECCRSRGLKLYLDGARLGAALSSKASDLKFSDLRDLVDVFYVGGTKNGALLGEAIVVNRPGLDDFRRHLKQRGALLAKGRLLGIQFRALFRDDLWLKLARHADQMAELLAAGLGERGVEFLVPPVTNQIFPVMERATTAALREQYGFYDWLSVDAQRTAIRLVTSWATPEEAVVEFLADFDRIRGR